MDHDNAYDERFDPDQLGRSGNEVINVSRDDHSNDDKQEPTHWDVTERTLEGEVETYHILDGKQTWLHDF